MTEVLSDEALFDITNPLWAETKPCTTAQRIRASISMFHPALDNVPDYVWSLVDIAAHRGLIVGGYMNSSGIPNVLGGAS